MYLAIYYVCRGNKDLATQITGIGATHRNDSGGSSCCPDEADQQVDRQKGALVMGASISFLFAIIQPFTLSPEHPYLLLLLRSL